MSPSTERTVMRWVHILCGLPILGYIYGPPEEVQQYAPVFRLGFVPVMLLAGLWMWKGHLVRRLFSGRQAVSNRTQ